MVANEIFHIVWEIASPSQNSSREIEMFLVDPDQ